MTRWMASEPDEESMVDRSNLGQDSDCLMLRSDAKVDEMMDLTVGYVSEMETQVSPGEPKSAKAVVGDIEHYFGTVPQAGKRIEKPQTAELDTLT